MICLKAWFKPGIRNRKALYTKRKEQSALWLISSVHPEEALYP